MRLFTSNWQTKITQLPLNENADHFFLNGGLDKHMKQRETNRHRVWGRRGGGEEDEG